MLDSALNDFPARVVRPKSCARVMVYLHQANVLESRLGKPEGSSASAGAYL